MTAGNCPACGYPTIDSVTCAACVPMLAERTAMSPFDRHPVGAAPPAALRSMP